MDFALSDEQQEFKETCHRFAAEVIRPAAPSHDADESTPWEVIKAARESGLDGLEHLQRWRAQMAARPACQRGIDVPMRLPDLTEDAKGVEEFVKGAQTILQR